MQHIQPSSPGCHSPLVEMQKGVLMAFIHHRLLLLICLLGCSQLSTTAFQPGLARDGAASPSVLSRETLAAKSRDLWGLLSTCSPPRDNPTASPAELLSALPSPLGHRQSQGRTSLSRTPRCKLWYTTHFSISISHCKGAGTAVFILLPPPLRCGGEEVHF